MPVVDGPACLIDDPTCEAASRAGTQRARASHQQIRPELVEGEVVAPLAASGEQHVLDWSSDLPRTGFQPAAIPPE